jgi:methylaspartate mutase epsilon subunit
VDLADPGGRSAARGRLTDAEFEAERREVLASWPTGAEVDLDEAFEYHHNLPPSKDVSTLYGDALAAGRPLVYPRTGEASLERHIETLHLLEANGADLMCTHADSYTRTRRFQEAGNALDESLNVGKSLLNGVPVVNYGTRRMREVVERSRLPNQYRQGTPEGRLATEVVLAAGYRSVLGGIIGSIPHMRDMPIGECVRNWQYVDRLVGIYEEAGVSLHREYYGALMGMVMPPCLMVSSLVFDALLAAEQGVRRMSLGINNNLHLCQDVATLRVLQKLSREYLDRFGFADVEATPLFHMWMGPFPQEEPRAYALIVLGALTAIYAGASAVIVKTADEAFGAPTAQANATATRLAVRCLDAVGDQTFPDTDELALEMDIIERETRALIDKALELGDGAIGRSVEAAFAAGTMDIPLAPATGNAGKAIAARDATGAVRFYDTGLLPFPEDIVAFHREKVAQRAAKESVEVNYKMVLRDISMKAFDSRVLVGLGA